MASKGTVLIIDDEEIIRDLFKRFLSRQGYGFLYASNGHDGIKAIIKSSPELVFLDLKMPGMDGMEVLKKIKEINKAIPVILLTGHGNMDSVIRAVQLGAYNFIQKPIENLETLIVDIDRAIESYRLTKKNEGLVKELSQINSNLENKVKERTLGLEEALKEIKATQAKVQEEIKTVSLVQQRLLPEAPPQHNGLDAAAVYLASSAVGGDYYDYFKIDNEKIGVVIADISGHGLPAAFIMTMVKILLIYLNKQNATIKEALNTLNEVLNSHIPTNNFVSMLYGVLDTKNCIFDYINAGHEPLIHIIPDSKKLEAIAPKSPFLGIDPDVSFIEDRLQMKKGDKLIFTTDGIIEACNTKNELFGQKRLNDIITKNMTASPKDITAEIISELSIYCTGTTYVDDITLIVLELTK